MKQQFDLGVFQEAQLTPKHVMPFLPVARPTISSWFNKRRSPSIHVLTPVLKLQAAVEKALKAEELPLTAPVSPSEAKIRIHAIIKRHL